MAFLMYWEVLFHSLLFYLVWETEEIRSNNATYKLNKKIVASYKRGNGLHMIENEDYGIYAFGETMDEAEASFYDESDFIYTKYSSLDDALLTDDVIFIKEKLNRIVKNRQCP